MGFLHSSLHIGKYVHKCTWALKNLNLGNKCTTRRNDLGHSSNLLSCRMAVILYLTVRCFKEILLLRKIVRKSGWISSNLMKFFLKQSFIFRRLAVIYWSTRDLKSTGLYKNTILFFFSY